MNSVPFHGKLKSKSFVVRRLLAYEAFGFAAIIAIIWANELFDLPHHVLGAPVTDINWREACLETLCILILAGTVLLLTFRFLKHVKYLEGFLVVCAFCKKIRLDEDTWVPIEQFVREGAEVEFSHSYCPECLQRHYGRLGRHVREYSG